MRIAVKNRRQYGAQILRELPKQAPRASDWAPTFEELFLVDPQAFTTSLRVSSSHAKHSHSGERRLHRRRPTDPDGLPLSTDPTVLDGDALTHPPETSSSSSLLAAPPIRKRPGKERARDAEWLQDVWSTPEFARLALRTRPTFDQVLPDHPLYEAIQRYKVHFQELLATEQAEAERAVLDRLARWDAARLQAEGHCMVNLSAFWLESTLFGRPVAAFVPSGEAGQTLPFHRFTVGTQVLVSLGDPLKDEPLRGSVIAIPASGTRIDVCFPAKVPGLEKSAWRLDATLSDIAHQRMLNAIETLNADPAQIARQSTPTTQYILQGTRLRDALLRHSPIPDQRPAASQEPPRSQEPATVLDHDLPDAHPASEVQQEVEAELRAVLGSHASPLMLDQRIQSWARRYSRPDPIVLPGDPELPLNSTQVRAIALMLASRVSLVQGPPGTGKTKTIVETIRLLKRHFHVPYPILVCTYTNIAVDNLVEGLGKAGLRPLRFGSSGTAPAGGAQYTLRARRDAHVLGPHLDKLLGRIERLNRDLRGLRAAEPPNPAAIARREKEVLGLRGAVFKLERLLMQEIVEDSDVVCTTCISAGSAALHVADFPIVFLDEASMSTEPASLIPLMRGCEHVALIGDHKQLPPVITSDEAERGGLGRSLFERLTEEGEVPSIMLDVQYRMHPDLSRFPASEFYGRSLLDGTVSAHGEVAPALRPPASRFLQRGAGVVFLDHRHGEARRDRSRVNVGEARLVCDVVEDLLLQNEDLVGREIGVIAPYAAQISLLERVLGENRERWVDALGSERRADEVEAIEVKTVDGFEGREKEVIIFSTVRNNGAGQIGFLADRRRLNVGLTRAKRGLFVAGSVRTLGTEKSGVWARYVEYLRARSLVVRLDG
ncbi:P-loop containing nucleoside triphosphate hydrolase protein [Auricularia subglabra TFB-10046 SS5]|nr:P-loop containing nucleoside triphosphate hydrolase protein [Auricularia subglabra TFB-10046 SS5]